NQILDISLRCLMAHLHPEWGDRDALDVFNRLLAKNVRPSNWTRNTHLAFQRGQIRSRREQWTMHALAKLKRGHPDPRGDDFDCPLFLLSTGAKRECWTETIASIGGLLTEIRG